MLRHRGNVNHKCQSHRGAEGVQNSEAAVSATTEKQDASSSEETKFNFKEKPDKAVVAFRNNCYGSKVVKP